MGLPYTTALLAPADGGLAGHLVEDLFLTFVLREVETFVERLLVVS